MLRKYADEPDNSSSFLGCIDPRIKLITLIILSWTIAAIDSKLIQVISLALGITFILFSRLSYKEIIVKITPVNIFIFFIWLTAPFTTQGEPFWTLSNTLTITKEGVDIALAVSLRSNAIILITIALLSTSSITHLTHAMSHLRLPQSLIQLFYFTWRYIHMLNKDAQIIINAMKLRGFTLKTSLICYKGIAYLITGLFIKSYESGRQIERAMELRGFQGTFWLLSHFKLSYKDIIFLVFMLSIALSLTIWDKCTA